MKLALLDKDPAQRQAHQALAKEAGFHCVTFQSGRELMRALQRDGHDLFVVDWDLPDLAGPSLLEGIRNQIGVNPQLLLLTAPLASSDVARALATGADCVLAKPCGPEVLVAQLRAMARRMANCDELAIETYGDYRFDLPNVNHVFLPGHRVMVQVQSSLFPLYDRNPQTFVPNIFFARPGDYRKATQKVLSSSFIYLPVVSAP